MKQVLSLVVVLVLLSSVVYAGGIVTNSNQSADYARTLNRNASTGVDAVYFNPAGLTALSDGLHLYLSNQFIFQSREVTNDFAVLSRDTYTADVNAMLFPNAYAAYKTGKLAFSAGIAPVGGGGSADYTEGAPSFELMVMQMLQQNPNIPQFNKVQMDANFEGSSVYLGAQGGVSYQLNNMLSVAVGGRYVMANNTYEGMIRDISVQTAGGMVPIQGTELQVDAAQSGSAFTGILGANLTLSKALNVGLRYETLTPMEVENETDRDDAGLFPDGQEVNADIPALFAVGAAYQISPELSAEVSGTYYMNEGAEWSEIAGQTLAENDYEAGLALAYRLMPDLTVSAGYLYSTSGANEFYQQDISYSLGSNSVGLGARYRLMENLQVTFGFINTFYMEDSETLTYPGLPAMEQTYNKTTMDVALGVSYSL